MAYTLHNETIASTYDRLFTRNSTVPSTGTTTTGIVAMNDSGVDIVLPLYISTQRVGIGIAAPDEILHIQGAGEVRAEIESTDGIASLRLNSDTSGNAGAGESGSSIIYFDSKSDNTSIHEGSIVFTHSNAASNQKMQFLEGDNADVTMTLIDDKVGIGTVSPDNMLEVSHNVTTAVAAAQIFDNTIQGIHIAKTGTNDGAGSMLKFSADGDTNQAAIAHIADDTSGDANLAFYTSDAVDAIIERVRITSDGNVGIGTTNPAEKIVVNGSVLISESIVVSNDTVSDEEALEVLSNADSKYALRVRHHDADNPQGIIISYSSGAPDGAGDDFINCVDTGGARFQVHSSGDMTADGTSINSDERLKENITDATSKLDDINKLKVRSFNFRETDAETGQTIHSKVSASRKRIGFIAQEYEEVFPSLVREAEYCSAREAVEAKDAVLDSEGNVIEQAIEAVAERKQLIRKNLKWDALVPILVKAVQELSAKVEALENA